MSRYVSYSYRLCKYQKVTHIGCVTVFNCDMQIYTFITILYSVTWVDLRLTQNCVTYDDFASYILMYPTSLNLLFTW